MILTILLKTMLIVFTGKQVKNKMFLQEPHPKLIYSREELLNFGYLPFVWMSNSTRLNSIDERALRITYQDDTSTFQELLSKDNFGAIHHGNLQVLATEIFKIHQGLSPEIFRETFVLQTSLCNLHRNNTFERCQVYSVYQGTKSWSFLGPKSMEFRPSRIETIREPLIIHNKNKELDTLWMSMQII